MSRKECRDIYGLINTARKFHFPSSYQVEVKLALPDNAAVVADVVSMSPGDPHQSWDAVI
jgi:hypothetical protein